jgi:hypothetical protein
MKLTNNYNYSTFKIQMQLLRVKPNNYNYSTFKIQMQLLRVKPYDVMPMRHYRRSCYKNIRYSPTRSGFRSECFQSRMKWCNTPTHNCKHFKRTTCHYSYCKQFKNTLNHCDIPPSNRSHALTWLRRRSDILLASVKQLQRCIILPHPPSHHQAELRDNWHADCMCSLVATEC